MKFAAHSLLLISLAATFAYAQPTTNIPQVQHVIVVIQENRTPDNLFNQDSLLVQNGGHVQPSNNAGPCNVPGHRTISLSPTPLFTCWDPTHNHAGAHPSWLTTWDNGAMDGACGNFIALNPNCPQPACVVSTKPYFSTCAHTYVQNAPWNGQNGVLDPYFQLANQYGWANFMFQTNQGPSFPAHQFLFSGTSAPVRYNDPLSNCQGPFPNEKCWQWFDAENTSATSGEPTGCAAPSDVTAYVIDPNSQESHDYIPPSPLNYKGFPCYSHNSLPTLLDAAGISWRYYLREGNKTADGYGGYNLWNAPAADHDICQNMQGPDKHCTGGDYVNNVNSVLPGGANYLHDYAPILTDIANCVLPQVSWVIPDGNWSDHAGGNPGEKGDGGPSWVANIVNAIGAGGNCDNPVGYWADTVILVVWDDWGGYYDDVVPPDCKTNPCKGYAGGNGNGQQYVYGFRVPFLAISAYAKQTAQSPAAYTGYVSNTNHDFGSILSFIEYAFGTGGKPLGSPYGIGDVNWQYADFFAPDVTPQSPYGLYDFFTYGQSNPTPIPFRQITPLEYGPNCFHVPHPGNGTCFDGSDYPQDPDNDANESD
jgi:phospholipase C